MDNIVDVFNEFLDEEWALHQCACTEKDQSAYVTARTAFYWKWCKRVTIPNRSSYREAFEKQLELEQRRTLFQIKKYDGGEEGPIYRAYVGDHRVSVGPSGPNTRYNQNWYMRSFDGEWKVFGLSQVCADCSTLGASDGQSCTSCGGEGWKWFATDRVKRGELLGVHKIEAPASSRHKEEYDSE